MKPHIDYRFNGQPIPLFYHQRTELDVEGEVDEWVVEKVLEHKVEGGKVRFLTVWA